MVDGDLALVNETSGGTFLGIGTRYPAGIYKYIESTDTWEIVGDYYNITNKLNDIATNYATLIQLNTKLDSGGYLGTGQDLQNQILQLYQYTKDTWETISNNLKTYPYVINYTGNNIDTIIYSTPLGNINKSFAYTQNKLTSITLSGQIPIDIPTTKILSYIGNNVSTVSYI